MSQPLVHLITTVHLHSIKETEENQIIAKATSISNLLQLVDIVS